MQKNSILDGAIKIVSSVFLLGYSPFFPGTLASLAAFLTYILFLRFHSTTYLVFVLVITAAGLWLSDKAEKLFEKKDARQIVIDDFNGMLIGLLCLPFNNLTPGLIGFVIFRLIDTCKPYPIRRVEKLKGGLGVMGDDVIAGIYTNLILQFFLRISTFKF